LVSPVVLTRHLDRALIYPSHVPANARTEVPRPNQFNFKDYEELIIPTNDGEKLSAFYIRGPRGGPNSKLTVLMFHGNAGNIGHRLPIARMLIAAAGCNVFMLEYRGYGISTGQPDESGLNIDAQTALDYLRDRAETRDHKIVVYGQSLGGAVGIRLVAKNQAAGDISGLILENTFLSMRKLSMQTRTIYTPFPVINMFGQFHKSCRLPSTLPICATKFGRATA
jgi:pimeloyl-ACP methyl ester carboxylesterase